MRLTYFEALPGSAGSSSASPRTLAAVASYQTSFLHTVPEVAFAKKPYQRSFYLRIFGPIRILSTRLYILYLHFPYQTSLFRRRTRSRFCIDLTVESIPHLHSGRTKRRFSPYQTSLQAPDHPQNPRTKRRFWPYQKSFIPYRKSLLAVPKVAFHRPIPRSANVPNVVFGFVFPLANRTKRRFSPYQRSFYPAVSRGSNRTKGRLSPYQTSLLQPIPAVPEVVFAVGLYAKKTPFPYQMSFLPRWFCTGSICIYVIFPRIALHRCVNLRQDDDIFDRAFFVCHKMHPQGGCRTKRRRSKYQTSFLTVPEVA